MLEALFTLLGAVGIVVGLLMAISCWTMEVPVATGLMIFFVGLIVTGLAWFMMARQNTHVNDHAH